MTNKTNRRNPPTTPCSDTGSPTPPRPLIPQPPDISIDYVSATIPNCTDPAPLKSLAHADGHDWRQLPRGAMGYASADVAGSALVFYDAPQLAMGCHLQLKGEGCDQAESGSTFTTWQNAISDMLAAGVQFSRLDVALDDTSGALCLDTIEQSMCDKAYTSTWRTTQRHYERRPGTKQEGRTFNWGKGGSKLSLRIYDYAVKHGLPEGTHHVRVELQARDAVAQALALDIAHHGFTNVPALLLRYLAFREPQGISRIHRSPVARWWTAFLDTARRARMALPVPSRTLQTIADWLERQTAPSLALLRIATGRSWPILLQRLLSSGEHRMRQDHWALVPT